MDIVFHYPWERNSLNIPSEKKKMLMISTFYLSYDFMYPVKDKFHHIYLLLTDVLYMGKQLVGYKYYLYKVTIYFLHMPWI